MVAANTSEVFTRADMLCVHSVPVPERGPPPIVGAQGSKVSRGDVLQHKLLQA